MSNKIHLPVGTHVLADLDGVDFRKLDDLRYMLELMMKAVEISGATCVNVQYKKFDVGLTCLMLLEESHFSVHTYPSDGGKAFFCFFTCGNTCKPEKAMKFVIEALNPTRSKVEVVNRGFEWKY